MILAAVTFVVIMLTLFAIARVVGGYQFTNRNKTASRSFL